MNKTFNQASIDIILPNYNSADYISETIDSIINQTLKKWNLIIVDDNSNIETKTILKKYSDDPRIKIIWLKRNKNVSFCRNLAIRYAKSEYIAFIDSDDIWSSEKLTKQLNFMIKNNYYFTYTNYVPFLSEKKHKVFKEITPAKYFDFNKFSRDTSIATSTMMIKRSSMENIKFTNTKICEDYFFKCQVLKKTNYAYCLEENLTKYRIRKNSLQSNKIRNLYWIWYINKHFNKFGLLHNLISLFCISFNSLKKYGFK